MGSCGCQLTIPGKQQLKVAMGVFHTIHLTLHLVAMGYRSHAGHFPFFPHSNIFFAKMAPFESSCAEFNHSPAACCLRIIGITSLSTARVITPYSHIPIHSYTHVKLDELANPYKTIERHGNSDHNHSGTRHRLAREEVCPSCLPSLPQRPARGWSRN